MENGTTITATTISLCYTEDDVHGAALDPRTTGETPQERLGMVVLCAAAVNVLVSLAMCSLLSPTQTQVLYSLMHDCYLEKCRGPGLAKIVYNSCSCDERPRK